MGRCVSKILSGDGVLVCVYVQDDEDEDEETANYAIKTQVRGGPLLLRTQA